MTRDEYHFFLGASLQHHCIMGNDYYVTNEHRVRADGFTTAAGDVFGYDEITRQYYDRYRLPVMHTETNLMEGPAGDEAVNWLWKQWANVLPGPQHRCPDRGFHLVLPDGPDGLGCRAQAGEQPRHSCRAV